MIPKSGAAKAVALVVTLAGCSAAPHSGEVSEDYRFCVENGGDYEYDGWSGDYECDLPPEENDGREDSR